MAALKWPGMGARHGGARHDMQSRLSQWYTRLNQPISPTSRLWRYGLIAVVGLFTLTTLIQSLFVPVFEGSDEQRHYAYARYLVNNVALPPRISQPIGTDYITYKVGQEAGQPPLYYIPVALLTTLAPNADDVSRFVIHNTFASPSDDAGLLMDNHNSFLHGPEGRWPFQDVALAVHLGRLVSVLCGTFTLLAVYGIGRELRPARPAVALLATALFGSIPGYIWLSGVISNDVAVIMFVTLSMWTAVRIARAGPTVRLAILSGVFTSLATLSKVNGSWVLAIVWLALLASAWMRREAREEKQEARCKRPDARSQRTEWGIITPMLISMGIWVLLTGWWFAFGALSNGDPLGVTIHIVKPGQTLLTFLIPDLSLINGNALSIWDRTTWYSASWAILSGPAWIYQTFRYLYFIGLLGAVGLCAQTWLRLRKTPRASQPAGARVDILQTVCVILAVLFTLAFAIYWQDTGRNRLGRYLYPGLTTVAVLVAIGFSWWLERLRQAVSGLPHAGYWAFAVIVALLLQRAAVFSVVNTVTTLLPHPVIAPVPPDATRTQVTFLDPDDGQTPVATVVGYRLPLQDLHVGNAMFADICWKSTGYTRQSFPYSLQLVGPNDYRAGTRNSFHGLGSFPLINWKPGEEFCDPSSLYVAQSVDRPRAYNLVVTMFTIIPISDTAGPALPAVDGNAKSVYPAIGRVRVAPDPASVPVVTPVITLGDVAGLVSTRVETGTQAGVISVTVRWVALNTTHIDAKVFMHAVDPATDKVIAQSDHQPDDGWFPTSYWQKGDVIDDHFDIQLPAGADLAALTLRLGMYDSQSQARLTAVDRATGVQYKDDAIPVRP